MAKQNQKFELPRFIAQRQKQNFSDLDLLRIVSLAEVASLMGVSIDTLKRHHRAKFIALGERRFGMRVGDCLVLPTS